MRAAKKSFAVTKKKVAAKRAAAPSRKEVVLAKCMADLKEKVGEARPDAALLEAAFKACGPSVYKPDSATVAASDAKELERIRKGFIVKKLGVKSEDRGNAAIAEAIKKYGKSVRLKYRPVVYYLIAKELKKSAALERTPSPPEGKFTQKGLKIRKIGNSLGIVLPKDVLEKLQVTEGDLLQVSKTKSGVELTPSDAAVERLMELAEEIMEENREVLRALAK